MEEKYILAKHIVDEKYSKDNEFYYMYISALFGLFMKYPDNTDLVIEAFRKTKIIIEDRSVLEIQKAYDLNLISDEELDVQDPNVCTNYGVSDAGFGTYVENGKVQMTRENPLIVCSAGKCSPANLLNIFVHELNHIVKSLINCYGGSNEVEDGISRCYCRTGISFMEYRYNSNTDILDEIEYYSILDEVINVFQTTDILNYVLTLDGIVPDNDFQKYLDTLDKKEMTSVNGYEKCCELFKRIWNNELFKNILEEHLIDGNLEEVAIDFDNAAGMECFDKLADYLDDLDYLFCLNNKRKEFEKLYKKLDKLIKSITSHKIKK